MQKEQETFFAERQWLIQQWRKGFGTIIESRNATDDWINHCKDKISPIDVAHFLDRLKVKTSQDGILDLCIEFAKETKQTNPLLNAPAIDGFQKRKAYLIQCMNELMGNIINATTQENK